ncbi:MAG TPA: TVP38/TMEM64 family protein [Thermoanaerobaculia bacterium]|nr:TVP38/TMEM64 family protein [Thermoanaerobaculia bacterium]
MAATSEPQAAAGQPGPGESPASAPAGRSWGRLLLYLVIAVAVVAALIKGGSSLAGPLRQFAGWVQGLGFWGPVVFIAGYAVATVAFAPGALLTLAAGALFGLAAGTAYTLIGATLGASLAFLVARYLARRVIERKIAGNQRFAAIDRAVGKEGFKIVALLRLAPLFPFNLLNYALGLTQVPFLSYFAASIAMLPGTLLYVYFGSAAKDLASAFAAGKSGGKSTWILVGGLVATIIATTLVTRVASRALRRELGEPAAGRPGRPAPPGAASSPTGDLS